MENEIKRLRDTCLTLCNALIDHESIIERLQRRVERLEDRLKKKKWWRLW